MLTSIPHRAARHLLPLLLAPLLAGCPGKADEPDPRIAAQWAAPARCGQPAYAWREDLPLGEVLEHHPGDPMGLFEELTAEALQKLMADSGRDLGVAPVHDVASFRLRYRTQDRGESTDATAILALPLLSRGERATYPLMVYFHGTSGLNDACAPSAGLGDYLASMALASTGFVVVAPDYLGLRSLGEPSPELHAYVTGEPTAITSLDSVRAARALLPRLGLGVEASEQVAFFGGSQGGHAALFAARFAPYYAPDAAPAVVVASVAPADVVGEVVRSTEERLSATSNTAAVLAAWADWYGLDLAGVLLPPHDRDVPDWLLANCGIGGLPGGAPPAEIFTPAFLEAASAGFAGEDAWSCAVRENSLPHLSLEALEAFPTLFVQSESDELVHVPAERAAFDALCEQGMTLEYLECAGATHTQGALDSVPLQLEFVRARLAGEPWPAERICQRSPAVDCG
ncbi:MAG: lipase family protein [Deltaproteobacteria bacterium]|nr:lipase family protein [Deltaproteobacteria bacterium]